MSIKEKEISFKYPVYMYASIRIAMDFINEFREALYNDIYDIVYLRYGRRVTNNILEHSLIN